MRAQTVEHDCFSAAKVCTRKVATKFRRHVSSLYALPTLEGLLHPLRKSCLTSSRTRLARQRPLISCSSADANAEPFPQSTPSENKSVHRKKLWLTVFGVGLAAVGLAVWHAGPAGIVKGLVANSALGKSGFMAALSLIFLSELGDKTFFIAALMAMKLGKWVTFGGTMAALSFMSVISVVIGCMFKNVPDMLTTSVPVGEYIGIALLLYFGYNSLKDGLSSSVEDEEDSELSDAQEEVERAEKGGKITAQTPWTTLLEVTSLIFVAEWGDRSMLATIALGASQSPIGVASGAIAGHAMATLIAIVGGTLLKQYISEKTVSIIGGVCFLLFAVLTLFHIF